MLLLPGRVQVDVPPWAPLELREPIIVTHWHADHWAGLKRRERASKARLYSPSLQHSILLTRALLTAGVNRYSRPARFPFEFRDAAIYYLRVIHTFESYNILVVDREGRYAVLYTADLREMPHSTLNMLKEIVEKEGVRRLTVLADATYYDTSTAANVDDDMKITPEELVELAERKVVVMPVLTTGRWASVLRLLEVQRYAGPVYVLSSNLYKLMSLVASFTQPRFEARYYPVRTRVNVIPAYGNGLNLIRSGYPAIYLVSGGMIQTSLAQKAATMALNGNGIVVVSASQLKGTPGYEMARKKLVYRLEHPILRGHMLPEEWTQLLNNLEDALHNVDMFVVPIHTTLHGAKKFVEDMNAEGYTVPRFEVMDVGGYDVVYTRIGRVRVMSGIAPEEPESIRESDVIEMRYKGIYNPLTSSFTVNG